ncbi:FGGY-family carbohydrate kinase [Streptomyces griseoruber]
MRRTSPGGCGPSTGRHSTGRPALPCTHPTRAVIEGVGQQLALVRDSLVAAGAPITSVRATGGALRSSPWAETVAAALETPLEITDDTAGSGFGAAIVGRRALGAESHPCALPADVWARPYRTVSPDPAAVRTAARARPLVERCYEMLRGLSVQRRRPWRRCPGAVTVRWRRRSHRPHPPGRRDGTGGRPLDARPSQ